MRAQMKQGSRVHSELFWPRTVVRKLLNISDKESDFSADTDDENDADADSDSGDDAQAEASERVRTSRFKHNVENDDAQVNRKDTLPRIRRRKSETFRAQYISTKEIRVRVGTWNVGGKNPPEDLDIDEWIDINDPADIYVLGLQEIVPLNAGNIFGAEDNRPVTLWEEVIRDSLNRVRPKVTKIKSFSDPPSPTKFTPFEDLPDIQEEILLNSDSDVDEEIHDIGEEVHPFNDERESTDVFDKEELLRRFSSSSKRMVRLNCLREVEDDDKDSLGEQVPELSSQPIAKLTRMLSGSQRLGLSWPERPLNLLPQHGLDVPTSLETVRSLTASKSLKTFKSFKCYANDVASEMAFFAEVNLEALMKRKRRVPYVRIVSKQMVGVFLTVWVRRNLRRHIQNLKVSAVGVGVMGYIGNKGSISVSMSIYQTLFCFICTHLTSGEREVDKLKRNADVQMIYRRTLFHSLSGLGLPQHIQDHERMIWLGDLNYRLNLSYEKARELISEKKWSELFESDQLVRELKRGRVFDGWSEGQLKFPPTYKYEINSDKYIGDDPKAGRRTPAWCDRILSRGRGMKQLNYKRAELRLSDHRPVSATFVAEVEIFSPRRLQKALTFTDAEIEDTDVLTDIGTKTGITCLTLEQDYSNWEK